MYFKSLTITNFKSFRHEEFTFSEGLNYIVGDNNCGKSTVVEALQYLAEGARDISTLQNNATTEPFSVEVIIAGADLCRIVEDKKYSKYKEYLNNDDDELYFKVRRSPEEKEIEQNGKSVKLDGKKITFWNSETEQFENPSGIDALFKSLVDIVPVLADTTTSDVVDFGTTKTLGRLIAATSKDFQRTEKWRTFQEAHAAAFSMDDGSFASLTKNVTSQVENLVQEQYGPAEIRLDFTLPEAATFVKGGQLLVKDGSYETPLADKGTGMQRAVTLALIQVYSQLQHEAKEHAPLTLLLDEPETWLHPRAQLQLSEALVRIAENEQLFLITHSPYMLRSYRPEGHRLLVFSHGDDAPKIHDSNELGLLSGRSPSWGEITYFAFGIPSPEFHDELWGEVYALADCKTEKQLNSYLHDTHRMPFSKQWRRDDAQSSKPQDATLSYYIRNSIHHPENRLNDAYSQDELKESTEVLVKVLQTLRPNSDHSQTTEQNKDL